MVDLLTEQKGFMEEDFKYINLVFVSLNMTSFWGILYKLRKFEQLKAVNYTMQSCFKKSKAVS